MWQIRLLVLAGVALTSFAAGGWTVYQRWSVSALEQTVADQKRALADKQAELDNERENARKGMALAAERGQDAAAARARAVEAEAKTDDLQAEWAGETERAVAAARQSCPQLDMAKLCPGISRAQWDRLRRDVPIGGRR